MFFDADNHDSYRIIKINDYSIIVCLFVTALMLFTALLLTGRYSFQEPEFQKPISVALRQAVITARKAKPQASPESPVAAVAKPAEKVQKGKAILPQKISETADQAKKSAIEAGVADVPVVEEKKIPAGEIKAPQKPVPESGKVVSKQAAKTSSNVLVTMRGGRHEKYASIVFQFRQAADYENPRREGPEIRFILKDTQTVLRPFRKYKTFDSWVRLKQADEDIDVHIGVPENFKRLSAFSMTVPDRLVVNLYDKNDLVAGRRDDRQAVHAAAARVPVRTPAGSRILLRTLRGGRHKRYASIVFEFNGPIDFNEPRIENGEIRFILNNVATRLRVYRKYRTFDSWVRLQKTGPDLYVRIGIPERFVKLSAFLMSDPDRYVVNLYDR